MTNFKISDEVVEAAMSALRVQELAIFGEVKTPANGARREAIKAAIEALLPVMFEHCGWRYWSEYPEQFRYSLGPGRWIYCTATEWRPNNAEQVFRLKEPK